MLPKDHTGPQSYRGGKDGALTRHDSVSPGGVAEPAANAAVATIAIMAFTPLDERYSV